MTARYSEETTECRAKGVRRGDRAGRELWERRVDSGTDRLGRLPRRSRDCGPTRDSVEDVLQPLRRQHALAPRQQPVRVGFGDPAMVRGFEGTELALQLPRQ